MKETFTENIEKLLVETITEKPLCFEFNGRFFYLYPPSLGVSLLSAEYIKEIELDKDLLAYNEDIEMLRIVYENKESIIKVIAMHSFKRRSDLLNEEMMKERISIFSKLELPALVVLTKAILDWNTWHSKLVKHYNLDKEAQQRKKIADFKNKDRSSVSFGGRSIFGALIDNAAERYGWQVGYIVWGISIINLNMMLSDSTSSVYLTKEEKKKLNVSTDNIFINADDPNQKKEIARLFGKKKKKQPTTQV